MDVLATSREAIFEPDARIWTSLGYIEAKYLVGLETRWLNDEIFQIKVSGQWVKAQSQDFLFSDSL